MVVSAEMAIVYRFHEFIIPSFPLKDASNNTISEQDLFSTGFNSAGFINAGLENVLRGMVATHIPNFKSGIDEAFRSAGKYRGQPFDLAAWSIVHEREQGLPTFNVYFRAYNEQDPAIEVPIRDRWEDFSSDPEAVAKLKRLYETPDDVDLTVGVQLDEEFFPGTTVPKSALIISLFSLFGMGNSDRFSVGFAMMRCFLVDTPWDCHPSNALEALIWAPDPKPGFPNYRFYDQSWITELDFQAHGTNLLWRLVTENTEIDCLQARPLFPADAVTNPILCAPPKPSINIVGIVLTGTEIIFALVNMHRWKILFGLVLANLVGLTCLRLKKGAKPPVLQGWPLIGKALDFQKNPKTLLLSGFEKYGQTLSRSFGIKLASLTHFVLSKPEDIKLILDDNSCEKRFSLHGFLESINAPIITGRENFESDLHTKLIATHFGDPETIRKFGRTIELAANDFIQLNPLVPEGEISLRHDGLRNYCTRFITYTVSRCVIGAEAFDDKELLHTFLRFNDDAIKAMGLASLLPKPLQFLASFRIQADYKVIRRILVPVIRKARSDEKSKCAFICFLPFILEATSDDDRAAGRYLIILWLDLVPCLTVLVQISRHSQSGLVLPISKHRLSPLSSTLSLTWMGEKVSFPPPPTKTISIRLIPIQTQTHGVPSVAQ